MVVTIFTVRFKIFQVPLAVGSDFLLKNDDLFMCFLTDIAFAKANYSPTFTWTISTVSHAKYSVSH
ncbi:hypothetical protein [Nonlabens agnitus]|uniref:hypothetical protein n=1 Tax=Nonlabens agnitus TaxID=870484 RepID=UPI0011B2185E|nr:hypothetical protein [Nonlabens agnitus]